MWTGKSHLWHEANIGKSDHIAEAAFARSRGDNALNCGKTRSYPRARPFRFGILLGFCIAICHGSNALKYSEILNWLSIAANNAADLQHASRERVAMTRGCVMRLREFQCVRHSLADTCRILARRAKSSVGKRRPSPSDGRVSSRYSNMERDCVNLQPSMSKVGIW